MSVTWSADAFYVAIETSGRHGSVAVARGGDVLARASLDEQGRHAARVVPAVAEVLEEGSVDPDEIAGVVVGEGPGSFTGVRVAAATAKGLAAGWGVPLWAVSSLVAGALAEDEEGVLYVLFDARGTRVYGACYRVGPTGVETLVPPHGGEILEVAYDALPEETVFVGDGAEHHAPTLLSLGFPVGRAPRGRPTADGLIAFLRRNPDTQPVDAPQAWEPRYVREWSR